MPVQDSLHVPTQLVKEWLLAVMVYVLMMATVKHKRRVQLKFPTSVKMVHALPT